MLNVKESEMCNIKENKTNNVHIRNLSFGGKKAPC